MLELMTIRLLTRQHTRVDPLRGGGLPPGPGSALRGLPVLQVLRLVVPVPLVAAGLRCLSVLLLLQGLVPGQVQAGLDSSCRN